MKKSKIVTASLSFIIASILLMSFDIESNNGKSGYSGAPGENKCNFCHTSFALNDGLGSVSISTNMPGNAYTPGQTYSVSVTVNRSGSPEFGFDIEALRAGNTSAGTFAVTNSTEMQIANSSNGRSNVIHKANGGLTNDSHTFTFNWTAPVAGTGNITFYATGNGADNHNDKPGDHIYSTSLVVSEVPAGIFQSISENEPFTIFPNPATDELNIHFSAAAGSKINFGLYSLEGKFVQNIFEGNGTGDEQTIKSLLDYDIVSGIYLLKMNNGQKVSYEKIIVR